MTGRQAEGDKPPKTGAGKGARGGARRGPKAPATVKTGTRLQKIIADAGVTSRRKAEELITAGRVSVNGKVVTELGARANPNADEVMLDGERLRPTPDQHIYLMMNKPRGTLCSASEAEGKDSIYKLLPHGLPRVFSVGRLDVQSEGLLLLTNDGDLSHRLTHPGSHVPKVYDVKVQGELNERSRDRIEKGLVLDGRRTLPVVVEVDRHSPSNTWYRFTLLEGRNRQIRRMCEAVGVNVLRIRRVQLGPLPLGSLPLGAVRPLDEYEVEALRKATE